MVNPNSGLPAPMTPPDCDLRDFTFVPINIVQLFSSRFHAIATDAEWRAGVTLWLKSFHQVPAASLPDNDVELARIAEMGRDVKSWKKVREIALHGWEKCSDGRLYHAVVAEKALTVWNKKLQQREKGAKGNRVRWGNKAPTSNAAQEKEAKANRISDLSPSLSDPCGDACAIPAVIALNAGERQSTANFSEKKLENSEKILEISKKIKKPARGVADWTVSKTDEKNQNSDTENNVAFLLDAKETMSCNKNVIATAIPAAILEPSPDGSQRDRHGDACAIPESSQGIGIGIGIVKEKTIQKSGEHSGPLPTESADIENQLPPVASGHQKAKSPQDDTSEPVQAVVTGSLRNIQENITTDGNIENIITTDHPAPKYPDGFEAFWAAYPVHQGKKPCAAVFARKRLWKSLPAILADIALRKAKNRRWIDGFATNPLTYLNQELWLDDWVSSPALCVAATTGSVALAVHETASSSAPRPPVVRL